jgi:alanyl-tRNA synthetase
MLGDDIRATFLAFFKERDHRLYPSSSLIPPPETNLLLTTAGMVQFRPFFLGIEKPPHPRATSVQKSFRTTDLEEVGDQSHLTLFEMLGNFSFGDYFKKEAIAWAWELVTKEFGLDPGRLWATVYEDDDESEALWISETEIPKERIQHLGKDSNFWDMGVPGPGGPNSELFYDRGEAYGQPGGPAVNDNRYLEIYNLVFMQYETDGRKNPVKPLGKPCVDTGMGLDRMATILQDAPSIYDTDLFAPIMDRAADVTRLARRSSDAAERLHRILTDHARSAAFLIADGVTPSNEGRGYILRRVMRRAITMARLEGVTGKLLQPMTEAVVERFAHVYPELRRNAEGISLLVGREEERFTQTLEMGLRILEDAITKTPDETLPADVAFRLQDTFGFPLDITRDVAGSKGLRIDEEGYERLMREQRERSRQVGEGRKRTEGYAKLEVAPTDFLGYRTTEATGRVVALVRGVDSIPSASEGDEVGVVLDRTPFYSEGGGQIGDHGVIVSDEARADVFDTQAVGTAVLHRARITSGELKVGDEVHAVVDPSFRAGTSRAHTATHVLHHTLRNVLGEHVRQHGSLVESGRLRFDFSHFAPVDRESLDEIEETVNQRVSSDDAVSTFETSLHEAIDRYHAMAFFEDKYGDVVRVVQIGDYSYELCGGTHVPHTGRVGFVKVLGEASIGSNLRRVEALTGLEGLRYVNQKLREAERAAALIKVPTDELYQGIERLVATQKEMQKALEQQARSGVAAAVDELVREAREAGRGKLVVAKRSESAGVLRELAIALRDKLRAGVVILGTASDGGANLVAAASKDLGVDARMILSAGAPHIGGKAGGKPDLAMGGGPDPAGIDRALAAATTEAERLLS